MTLKKHIIEETVKKLKTLLENNSNLEQKAVTQNSNRDVAISKNINATMDQAMNTVIKSLPNVLANFAKNSGDKDGVIDVPGVYDNKQQTQQIQEGNFKELTFNESKFLECLENKELTEGGIIGLVASAPAILKYGGQATKWIGKKMNSQWFQKWGETTAKAGESLHHKYIHTIESVLKKLMPNATPEQIEKAANGVFLGVVGVLFAGGLADPGMLTGVKGTELGQEALAALQKSLPTLGFA